MKISVRKSGFITLKADNQDEQAIIDKVKKADCLRIAEKGKQCKTLVLRPIIDAFCRGRPGKDSYIERLEKCYLNSK